jgi:hypothetical protein
MRNDAREHDWVEEGVLSPPKVADCAYGRRTRVWKLLRKFERMTVRRGHKWVMLRVQFVHKVRRVGVFEEARRWLHGALCRRRTVLGDSFVGPYSQGSQNWKRVEGTTPGDAAPYLKSSRHA